MTDQMFGIVPRMVIIGFNLCKYYPRLKLSPMLAAGNSPKQTALPFFSSCLFCEVSNVKGNYSAKHIDAEAIVVSAISKLLRLDENNNGNSFVCSSKWNLRFRKKLFLFSQNSCRSVISKKSSTFLSLIKFVGRRKLRIFH